MKNLNNLIRQKIKQGYQPEYQESVKDTEALGLLIAEHCQWSGQKIMETFAAALEDANFHNYCVRVFEWIEDLNQN